MEICKERFEAWLFSQPLGRHFEFGSTTSCDVCCFLNETQRLKTSSGSTHSKLWNGEPYFSTRQEELVMWPDWLIAIVNPLADLSINAMQARYRELFPETPEPEAVLAERMIHA